MSQILSSTDFCATAEVPNDDLTESAAIDTAISEAEAEYDRYRKMFDARAVLSSLRETHLG